MANFTKRFLINLVTTKCMEEKIQFVEYIFGTDVMGLNYISKIEEVSSRDYKELNKIPNECYVFRFFDQTLFKAQDGEVVFGKPKNISGLYYPQGQIMTLEEIKKEFPPEHTLIQNMKKNGWRKQVKARDGHFYPLDLEDRIV